MDLLLAVVFSLSSCILIASTGREASDMLYQMDRSLIFGICKVLIILLFCLANKPQPDHSLQLYCRFKTDVSDRLFSESRMG